jgi:thiamine-phosphate pyrophosphorylase
MNLVAAGVHVLQLRDKRLDDRTRLARARRLRELTRGAGTLFIVNDRADLALLAEADGLHVGQEELAVHEARRIVGAEMLIGVSTHSLEQARRAVQDGADYLGLGPTFPSETKHFEHFPGLALLRQAAAEISLPAFAIGGITLDNLPQVLAAGIARVAMGGGITNAPDPTAAARTMLESIAPAS